MLIRVQNAIEDDLNQTNSVEMMASWQMWLASHAPFVGLESGSNRLVVAHHSFFSMASPFRWYRIVEEQMMLGQELIDISGNFKANVTYQLFLVDDGENGRFAITESTLAPVGVNENQALWVAQFATKENGVIDGASIIDSQVAKHGESHPMGKIYVQYPSEKSPQELYPRQQWQEVSSQFAGDFFRVAGGNASAFGSGRQSDSAPNITGVVGELWDRTVSTGAFFSPTEVGRYAYTTGSSIFKKTEMSASRSSASYGRRNEVAPQNQTIRLWKRVG